VLELNSVVVKKAMKERTGGEGETPFRKRIKRDDFIDIFHGKWVAEGQAPIDEIPLLQ
jgi:hypothetical protein